MPSPSKVGRTLFAAYFDTSNPQAMSKGLELWGSMNAGQQRHVLGHLLYFTLLELGRLNRTGEELLEAVNTSVEQLEATLSGGVPDEEQEQPSNVVRLPHHINAAPAAEASDDEASDDEAGDDDEASDDDEADNDDGDDGGEGDADGDGD